VHCCLAKVSLLTFLRCLPPPAAGGQKVKLVLAAAMWNNPQLLVLDEPTNYLDRESLGALADAIKAFQGGVVIISHHHEFTSALCNTTWRVAEGKVTVHTGADGTSVDQDHDGAEKTKPTAANHVSVTANAR
jgi:elongation factor 3